MNSIGTYTQDTETPHGSFTVNEMGQQTRTRDLITRNKTIDFVLIGVSVFRKMYMKEGKAMFGHCCDSNKRYAHRNGNPHTPKRHKVIV